MPVLSPTNLETASYGTAGWNAIYSSNFQKLNNYLARFQDLWSGTPADWNILRYSSSSGRWIRDTIANLSTQLEAFLAKRDLSNITSLGNILNLDGHGSNLDADRLDGYHASQTPTANTVPVSDSNGRLALGWIPQGHGSGLNADRLDGVEESQFVRTDETRTITVQHTFNPSTAGAPFILGNNAQGRLVTGLNADQVDGFHASPSATTGRVIPVTDEDGIIPVYFLPQNVKIFSTTGPSTNLTTENDTTYDICSISVTAPSKAPDTDNVWRVIAIVVPTRAGSNNTASGNQEWYVKVSDGTNTFDIGYSFVYKSGQNIGGVEFKGFRYLENISPGTSKTYTLQIQQGSGDYNITINSNSIIFNIILL